MKHFRPNSFQAFIQTVESTVAYENEGYHKKKRIVLFRGQSRNYDLLPSIARNNPNIDTSELEKRTLNELKLRSYGIIDKSDLKNDWDWLVYAQHFGLRTRLLDWSINPLVALFFSIYQNYSNQNDSFVYMFVGGEEFLIDESKDSDPFSIAKTRILRPKPNNKRIVAQNGWFTAHKFSKNDGKFVSVNSHGGYKDLIYEIKIPNLKKRHFMEVLNKLGVNYQAMFPDPEGLCNQINWENVKNEEDE